ncbi:MAG: MFS transporter [Clostridia bacterium]|nr:MFS transporter [Clostridia bacterium]
MNETAHSQPKLWTFIFIRVGMVTALTGIATQMLLSAFPQYLSNQGFSATQMGLVASGYTVCAMIMRIFAGNLIDKKGRRVMCLLGLALFTLPILGFLKSGMIIAVIVCLRFVQGFGASLSSLSVGTMAPDVLPKERLGEGVAYYGLFNSMATAIGPAIGISLIAGGEDYKLFLTALVMGIAATGVALTINYEKKGLGSGNDKGFELTPEELEADRIAELEAAEDAKRFFLWKFFDKKALPAAIITILITMSTTTITNFITPYGLELGLDWITSFYTIQAGFMVVARLTSGKLQRRVGRFKTLLIGLVLDIIAMFLLSAMTNNYMMAAAAAIRGLGGGLYFPLLNVLSVENASRSGRGKATSTYYAAFDLGAGIGAAMWGMVADMFGKASMARGYSVVFAGAGFFYVFSIAATYILLGKNERTK